MSFSSRERGAGPPFTLSPRSRGQRTRGSLPFSFWRVQITQPMEHVRLPPQQKRLGTPASAGTRCARAQRNRTPSFSFTAETARCPVRKPPGATHRESQLPHALPRVSASSDSLSFSSRERGAGPPFTLSPRSRGQRTRGSLLFSSWRVQTTQPMEHVRRPHSRSGLERRLQPAPAARERSGTGRSHLPSQRKPSGNRPVLRTGNRNSLTRCRAFRRVPIRCRFLLVKGGLAPLSHFPPDHAGSEPEVRCHFPFLARSDNAADGTRPPTPTAEAAWNAGFSRHPLRESAAEQDPLIFLHSGNRPVLRTGDRNSLTRCRAFRRVPIRCRFLLVKGGPAPLSHFPPDQAGSEPEVRCHFLLGAFR